MTNSMNKFYLSNSPQNTLTYEYRPVPWNFHFTLWIYAKNIDDATKIIEQIVPFFSPVYTVKANLLNGMNSFDLPITLMDISHDFGNPEQFKDRTMLIYSLRFTMKGFFLGPVQNTVPIKVANISYYVAGLLRCLTMPISMLLLYQPISIIQPCQRTPIWT